MRIKFIFFIALLILILAIYYTYSYNLPKWFLFNKKDSLKEWEEKIFKNKVLYVVQIENRNGFLLAKSKDACSGLLYRIKFYPKELPMISWKWKVTNFPQKSPEPGKGGWIEKDDYAARVYVIFPSWIFTQIKSIEYVWDEFITEETIITSPYFKNIKLIVAQTGKNSSEEWVLEERNIYQDYKNAFGNYPSGYIGAIALMTDTDNTLSTAEAFYTEIKVGYKND